MPDGYLALYMCIIAEKYTCPEKAFYVLHHPETSLAGYPHWLTEDIVAEMYEHTKTLSQRAVADIFGVSEGRLHNIFIDYGYIKKKPRHS